jgi:cytochrome c
LDGRVRAFLAAAALGLGGAGAGADEDIPAVPEDLEPCISCHAFGPDDPVLEGPTLWGVVGRPVASVAGFDYSAALRGLGGTWTAERLDRFLASPQAYAPGTKMELGGVKNAADRAKVIEFLETLRPAVAQ